MNWSPTLLETNVTENNILILLHIYTMSPGTRPAVEAVSPSGLQSKMSKHLVLFAVLLTRVHVSGSLRAAVKERIAEEDELTREQRA